MSDRARRRLADAVVALRRVLATLDSRKAAESRRERDAHPGHRRQARRKPRRGVEAETAETADASDGRGGRDAARGESIAAAHLESMGFEVVARNLRLGHDEADLVAMVPPRRDGDPPIVAIVEVKTTRTLAAPPHLRIDAGKRRRLVRFAERLLARDELADAFVRFDAVGVHLACDPPRVEHLPACFDARSPTDRPAGGRGHHGRQGRRERHERHERYDPGRRGE